MQHNEQKTYIFNTLADISDADRSLLQVFMHADWQNINGYWQAITPQNIDANHLQLLINQLNRQFNIPLQQNVYQHNNQYVLLLNERLFKTLFIVQPVSETSLSVQEKVAKINHLANSAYEIILKPVQFEKNNLPVNFSIKDANLVSKPTAKALKTIRWYALNDEVWVSEPIKDVGVENFFTKQYKENYLDSENALFYKFEIFNPDGRSTYLISKAILENLFNFAPAIYVIGSANYLSKIPDKYKNSIFTLSHLDWQPASNDNWYAKITNSKAEFSHKRIAKELNETLKAFYGKNDSFTKDKYIHITNKVFNEFLLNPLLKQPIKPRVKLKVAGRITLEKLAWLFWQNINLGAEKFFVANFSYSNQTEFAQQLEQYKTMRDYIKYLLPNDKTEILTYMPGKIVYGDALNITLTENIFLKIFTYYNSLAADLVNMNQDCIANNNLLQINVKTSPQQPPDNVPTNNAAVSATANSSDKQVADTNPRPTKRVKTSSIFKVKSVDINYLQALFRQFNWQAFQDIENKAYLYTTIHFDENNYLNLTRQLETFTNDLNNYFATFDNTLPAKFYREHNHYLLVIPAAWQESLVSEPNNTPGI